MIRNLEQKSGRTLDDWIAAVRASGLAKHGEIVKMLKSDHALTHGYANLVAIAARGGLAGSDASTDDLESAVFGGRKSALKPVYDVLRNALVAFGGDVEVAPKKSYVSFRRRRQFALAQPSTATRLDVGLNLKGVDAAGRLESAGGFNAMCTHRVRVESAAQVDAELLGWLRQAYESAL